MTRKVGINLLWMVPGTVGGSETYITRLLRGLSERPSDLEYTIFALPQLESAHPDLVSSFEVQYAPLSGQTKSFRVAGENTWLARRCRSGRIDLVHHGGGVVPLIRTKRPMLTIHDLQYLYYPEYFTRAKLIYLKTMMPRSAETARMVLTPSEFTRRSVIERLNIDASVVRVVPHGISPRRRVESTRDVTKHYGIDGPFFLYPAATYPHKNHLVLIEAMHRLRRLHPGVQLVLTGARGNTMWSTGVEMQKRVDQEVDSLALGDAVKRLGFVPGQDLDALYREAAALVFPSRFEGFGAPALEAMARGCPVIAANATALPEIVQDAGRLLSPDNVEHWTHAMDEILTDDELRKGFVKAGIERAARFTWAHSASVLEDSYHHVLETTL